MLKGVKPGGLSGGRSTEFDLVTDLKSAKSHEFSIAGEVLARADEASQ